MKYWQLAIIPFKKNAWVKCEMFLSKVGPYYLLATILGTGAVIFASINVVGGYLVTDRMLGMFKKKESANETKALTKEK